MDEIVTANESKSVTSHEISNKKTLARILESWYEHQRKLFLFFYYPSDEYVSYLMTVPELMFADELDCRDLFTKEDERERIMVFEIA